MLSSTVTAISRDPLCLFFVAGFTGITAALATLTFKYSINHPWWHSVVGLFLIIFLIQILGKFFSASARKARALDDKLEKIKGEYFNLTEKECQMMDVQTPTLYTYFRCDDNNNNNNNQKKSHDQAVAWLEQRVKDIVSKNRFLLGRLRTHPDTSIPSVWVPAETEENQKYLEESFKLFFGTIEIEETDEEVGFAKKNLPREVVSKCGASIIDEEDEMIWKIRILKSKTSSNNFAITLSQCHAVGDGYSVYKLYSLLDKNTYATKEDIPELLIERDARWDSKSHHLQHEGKQHIKKFVYFVKEIIMGALLTKVLSLVGIKSYAQYHKDTCQYNFYKIRKDWIVQEKKKYQLIADQEAAKYFEKKTSTAMASNADRSLLTKKQREADEAMLVNLNISTNDVLLAYAAEKWYSPRNFGMIGIAYEMRARFFTHPSAPPRPIDANRIGNYFEILLFSPEEIADPLKIRRLVNSKGRSSEIDKKFYDEEIDVIPKSSSGVSRTCPNLSNWVRFYKRLDFEGFKVALHAPVGFEDLDDKVGIMEPLAAIFVRNGDGDLGILNCCSVQPKNVNEAPLDGLVELLN